MSELALLLLVLCWPLILAGIVVWIYFGVDEAFDRNGRYSLRTLLIATTTIAVVLWAVIYAAE